MPPWFAKYGFPIEVIHKGKAEGGATVSGCADVKLVKLAKNIWIKGWETKEEDDVLITGEKFVSSVNQ